MTRSIVVVLLLMFAATAAVAQPQAQPPVVAEARQFMEAYGRDLARGDRKAISDRYDRAGAFFLVAGGREFVSHDALAKDYREKWTPPVSFEWQDLHFDAIGDEAVVVNGRFVWGLKDRKQVFTYTGFLRRQEGALRIRLEDETPTSPSVR